MKKKNNLTQGKPRRQAITQKAWDAIRAAAVATGSIRSAAERAGVSYDAARKRAERENWMTPARLDKARAAVDEQVVAQTQVRQIGTSKKSHSVAPVAKRELSAAQLLEAHMATSAATFKSKSAAALANAATHAAGLDGMLALASAGAIKAVVDAGCKLHGLGSESAGSRGPVVQIACLSASMRPAGAAAGESMDW